MERVQKSDEFVEINRLLEMEKSKADVAEKARASLEAELNLIKK